MERKKDSLELGLTPEEEAAYFQWVRNLAERFGKEGEILEEVTISFTFSPLGTHVVAHTGAASAAGHSIVLRD